MASLFKRTRAKLGLFTDIDMLLIVKKDIRGGICHSIHRYAKTNNKYKKNYDKDMESSYLECLDANNLYGWTMYQKLSVNGFGWAEELSQFKEDVIKFILMIVIRDIFLKWMLNIQKICLAFVVIYHFYLEGTKLKNVISLFVTFMTRKTKLCT